MVVDFKTEGNIWTYGTELKWRLGEVPALELSVFVI